MSVLYGVFNCILYRKKKWDCAKRLSELVNVPSGFKNSFQDFEINGESSYDFSYKDVKDLANMTRCAYDQSIHTEQIASILDKLPTEIVHILKS